MDAQQMQQMRQEIGEMKSMLKELAAAVTRLAIIEERQSHVRQATERIEETITTMIERIGALEFAGVTNKQTNDWVGKAVWAAMSGMAVYLVKKAGIL